MNTKEESPICQVCGAPFDGGPIVYCASCDTPHHKDCWNYLGHCSTFGCYTTIEAQKPSIVAINRKSDILIIDENTPVKELVDAEQMLDMASDYELTRSNPYMRMDLDTPLENFTFWSALLTGLASVWALSAAAEISPLLIGASLALGITYTAIDCTYLLDNRTRTVYYYRRVFGVTTRYRVCDYDEIHMVAVKGTRHKSKHSTWWNYGVVFITKDGDVFPVSTEKHEDYQHACRIADILADLTHSTAKHGFRAHELIVVDRPSGPLVKYEPYSIMNHPFLLLLYLFIVFFWLALMIGH